MVVVIKQAEGGTVHLGTHYQVIVRHGRLHCEGVVMHHTLFNARDRVVLQKAADRDSNSRRIFLP